MTWAYDNVTCHSREIYVEGKHTFSALAANQRRFLLEWLDVPHVGIEPGDIAKIHDQVPGMDEHGLGVQRR